MKPGKSLLAMAGTAVVLSLSIVVHAIGQFGNVLKFDDTGEGFAEAISLQPANFDQFATPGKEADAIYGDVVLRNGFLSAVIAQPLATRHANMTVKDVAGALIDLKGGNASGGDQLAAFYPGRKAFPYRSISLRDPKGKVIAPDTSGAFGSSSAVVVTAEGTAERPEVILTYELREKVPYLMVTSVFANRGSQPLKVALEDDFRADGGKEDMPRSPNGTASRFWLYDRNWGQAYGLDAEGYKLQLTSDARLTTIKYENAAGETSVTIPPGESFTLKRRLYAGTTIFDVHALAGKPTEMGSVQFYPDNIRKAHKNLVLEVSQGETVLGMARFNDFSVLSARLPVGNYVARLHFCGNALPAGEEFQVLPGRNEVKLKMTAAMGRIVGSITDIEKDPIPCKIELKPLDEGTKLNFGPETGEFAVRNLIYSANGQFEQFVPAGSYSVIISHGPEFDSVQATVDVKADGNAPIRAMLVRSVDTTGWVSGDFHSHSSPSGDNTSSQLGRVLNLVCEHVEFAPCTEHNRVSTYEPHIRSLKIEPFIASVPGIELTSTPLPLCHQNAFPMKYTPRTQDGGGPIAGPDLETQIERLGLWDDRSEKLLQVNHPDVGWMFYDKDGDGKPDDGYDRAFPFMDVMEIHPIEHALHLGPIATMITYDGKRHEFHNTVFNWLQLLNQGFRIYGVVNTDAHYNFHGSGSLRNWIQSSTDDPARIDHMEMVHAAEQGRLVMSNGPYLEVTGSETGKTDKVVSGQDLKASGGKVTLKVRVQCPNWLDVNRLTVLVNGRPHAVHNYTREKHPDAFRSGVVKFERSLDLDLKSDAHLVVVTGQEGGALGRVYGAEFGRAEPAAVSNPIFVDVDGNGFQPNKDTLDAPLPVKHPQSK